MNKVWEQYKEKSHPAWVCGLKLNTPNLPLSVIRVTPCVGVWIETTSNQLHENNFPSHPAWVCGLKLDYKVQVKFAGMSHPAWVCGLKPKLKKDYQWTHSVTPCVGVWIETGNKRAYRTYGRSHTLRGCVD